jgi:hypothetical protein
MLYQILMLMYVMGQRPEQVTIEKSKRNNRREIWGTLSEADGIPSLMVLVLNSVFPL